MEQAHNSTLDGRWCSEVAGDICGAGMTRGMLIGGGSVSSMLISVAGADDELSHDAEINIPTFGLYNIKSVFQTVAKAKFLPISVMFLIIDHNVI